MPRVKQDRSRKARHAHSQNIQDRPRLNHSPQERAVAMFLNVAALLPKPTGLYYQLLPPGAQRAIDAVRREAALLAQTQGE